MNLLLEILGSMGWSTSAHCLVQSAIAALTGGSAFLAAFHPATVIVGSLAGLAWMLVSKLTSPDESLPQKKPIFCAVSITIEVPSIRL